MPLAEARQRAASCYGTSAGFPPSPAIIAVARMLDVTIDELLGVTPPKVERVKDDSEARMQWKRFQMSSTPPGRDRKAVVRLVNSMVAVAPLNRNGAHGERNAR